ncbi:MAG: ketol-acid reductoisomerase [Myxococcota bacterium]
MAQIRYESDANVDLVREKKIAIVGYGSQGHAHALNLRDTGVEVRIGLHEDSKSREVATGDGFDVASVHDVAAWGDVVMLLAPDTRQQSIYQSEIHPHLRPGKTLMFGHGFNIRFGLISPPDTVDVSMIAPKGPGHRVRETFQEGGGVPALLAVAQDASGQADAEALAYACAIGAGRAGVLTTTFAEETETDLFGEQAVLCGGVSELVKAGFETLVEAGYQPEIAYFECLHELKLIVDLMYRGGLRYMRYSVSDTAEYGDYVSGRKVVGTATKEAMRVVLDGICDGSFAAQWVEESRTGRDSFEQMRRSECELLLEQVGAKLRAMMPFVEAVDVKPGD